MNRLIILLIGIAFIGSTEAYCQSLINGTIEQEIDTTEERMPDFIGGQEALFKYLGDNIQYPEKARLKGKEGKVLVNFTVAKDGSIEDVVALNSIHPLLDAEAIRLIESMPKWISGMQKGETVAVSYNIPINFKLSKKEKKR